MSEFYNATFRWPHRNASNVIITGSFDGWSCTRHLSRSRSGFFEGLVQIPWGEKVAYKYIVDGRWTTTDDRPTEMDGEGNLNNVFRAPARSQRQPTLPKREPTPKPEIDTKPHTEPNESGTDASSAGAVGAVTAAVTGVVVTAKQAAVDMVEALAPGTTETPVETSAAPTPSEPTPQLEPPPRPESPKIDPAPKDEPTVSLEPTPAPAPEPTRPATATTEVANGVVPPSKPVHVARQVRVGILPLAEPISTSTSAPVADVSEAKALDSGAPSNVPAAATVAPENQPSTHVPAKTAPEVKPSTPVPAPVNGAAEEKPATSSVAPAENKAPVNGHTTNGTNEPRPAPPVNGTTTNGTNEPKPAPANGSAEPSTPTAVNGAEKAAAASVNGKSTTPTPTPTKDNKKLRFPSLSARSLRHSRRRSSGETNASELGERNGQETNGDGKDSVSSRSHRHKRASLLGRLKDAFSHARNEPST